jgi:hypothetical protein
VRILESPAYTPDNAANQSWADFFGSLVHSDELSALTVYFAPVEEMQSLCSIDADACYDPDSETIVLPGNVPPDGTPIEELAAHEYGHHIALNRDNPPWNAYEWGTKRWASYEGVCPRVRAGTAFPGSEDIAQYGLNPGEAFAESYRVLNGGSVPWGRVDSSWLPDANDLDAIKTDVLEPYAGGSTTAWHGRFKRHAKYKTQYVRVATPLDGRLVVRLRGHGRLDGDLYAYDAKTGKRIAKRATSHRSETLRTTVCGPSKVEVDVVRYSGSGSYSVRVTTP